MLFRIILANDLIQFINFNFIWQLNILNSRLRFE